MTQASHRGGSASIPRRYYRILLWYEVILGQGFLRSVWFLLVRITPPKLRIHKHDVHESVHHDIIKKVTNKMQLYRLIYYL